MTDYRSLAINVIYWTLERKFLLLDPYAGGAKVQTSAAGAGGDSVSFSFAGGMSADPAASFRLHTIVCRPRYTVHVWVIPIETRPIHGESAEILRSLLSCALPLQIAVQKGCTAEWWRPGTGVNPESTGLAVRLRTLKMFSGSLWGTPAASLLKIPEKFNYLVCETKLYWVG